MEIEPGATPCRCENCEKLAREVARLEAAFNGVHKKYMGATRALSDMRKSRRVAVSLLSNNGASS